MAVATLTRAVRVHTDPAPVPFGTGITLRPGGPVPAVLSPVASHRVSLTGD